MATLCKCCISHNRKKIDSAISSGVPYATIAKKFSTKSQTLSLMAISRHSRHVLASLRPPRRVVPTPEPQDTIDLVQRLKALIAWHESTATAAENEHQRQVAINALREVRGCLEFIAKLSGELAPSSVNIFIGNGDLDSTRLERLVQAVKLAGDTAIDKFIAVVRRHFGEHFTPPTTTIMLVEGVAGADAPTGIEHGIIIDSQGKVIEAPSAAV